MVFFFPLANTRLKSTTIGFYLNNFVYQQPVMLDASLGVEQLRNVERTTDHVSFDGRQIESYTKLVHRLLIPSEGIEDVALKWL